MRYLILCIITVISINAFAQEADIIKVENINLKTSTIELPVENVIDIIKDNNNDIVVYSDFLGFKEIQKGRYKGQKTGNFKEGLVFKDGSKYEFSENETYLYNIDNKVYSKKIDFVKSVKYINCYSLQQKSLSKTSATLTIPSYYSIDKIDNSDLLIYSNYYESYGDTIIIYDENLNEIKKYKPFENGFNNFINAAIENTIYVITTPNPVSPNIKGFKISIIDSQNNFSIKERNYSENITPIRIITFRNSFVLLSNGILKLFNNNADIKWSKNINTSTSAFSVVGSELENKIFIIAEGSIVCLNFQDGSELWRIPLKKVNPKYEKPKATKNDYFTAYNPIDFQIFPDLNCIGILTTKVEQEFKNNTVKYSNKNLTLINYSGKIIKNISLKTYKEGKEQKMHSKHQPCKILGKENGFKIINEGKIEKYEK